jgi:hypothetical protein
MNRRWWDARPHPGSNLGLAPLLRGEGEVVSASRQHPFMRAMREWFGEFSPRRSAGSRAFQARASVLDCGGPLPPGNDARIANRCGRAFPKWGRTCAIGNGRADWQDMSWATAPEGWSTPGRSATEWTAANAPASWTAMALCRHGTTLVLPTAASPFGSRCKIIDRGDSISFESIDGI